MSRNYKRRYRITCGLWDAYKDFRNEFRLIHKLDRKQYVDICHLINKKIADKIIKESFEFRMPYRMGTLSIRKSKTKIRIQDGRLQKNKMIPDWERTWKMWHEDFPGLSHREIKKIPGKILIYNLNEHSNGYVMGWFWDKATCIVKNKSLYAFKPTKYNRLNLATWIKSEDRENDYFLSKPNRRYDGKRFVGKLNPKVAFPKQKTEHDNEVCITGEHN